MVFILIATTQRLQEGADGTSINTNHLACTWKVEMKREDSINKEEGNEKGGLKLRENSIAIKNYICNQT